MFNKSTLKKYLPEIINSLLVLVFGFVTYLYFEGLNWIGAAAAKPMNNLNFYAISIVLLVYDAGLIFYAARYFKLKIRWPFFFLLVVMCFFALIPIWSFPGAMYEGKIVYTIGGDLVGRYSLLTVMVFLSIFIFLFVVPSLIRNRDFYKLFIYISAIVGLVATVYSYINEPDVYAALFSNPDPYYHVPQSYTTHKNIYAYICVMAMLAEAYLLNEKEKPWHWVLFFYFFANVFLTFSKTCIALAILIVTAVLTYKIIKVWKTHRVTAIWIMGGAGVVVAFLTLITLVDFGGPFGKVHSFAKFLFYELPKINEEALGLRFHFFNVANEVLSQSAFTRFFGFGYGNWNAAYFASYSGNYQQFETMDVAYAVDMFQFGFPGLLFSLALWGLAIYLVVMQFIKKSKYAYINALMLSCYLLRTIAEAGDLTHPNLTGTAYYLILVCPMLTENTSFLLGKSEEKENIFSKAKIVLSKLISPIGSSISTVLSVLLLSTSFMASGALSTFLLTVSIILMAGGVLFPIVLFITRVALKKIDSQDNDREFLEASISAIFSLVAWAVPLAIYTGNSTILDGMTYLMVTFFAIMVMLVVNGAIVLESMFLKEKEQEVVLPKKKHKKKH